MTSLNDTIRDLKNPDNLPKPLPIVHMSNARWFPKICEQGSLQPGECPVFHQNLLYFFYGGAFYRSKKKVTQEPTELPVAFLFAPKLLDNVARYFPYDTGAAQTERYGEPWSQTLRNFDRYAVSNQPNNFEIPCKLIHYIYGSNKKYLRGDHKSNLTDLQDPLPELYNFLESDLTKEGCDHRKCIIECQVEKQVDLKFDSPAWVAFPEGLMKDFVDFCEKYLRDCVPDYYAYDSHKIFTPSEIEAKIEEEASKLVKKRYIKLYDWP
ncbi:hypothetical protein VB715_06765 [Crocosphaera sp. UHCC 0190]|uniref:hypothetical protein n=1 Tax=Crocosphaera sp. UHCC 0190 TaxID=3110246 RepID=UPI002B207BC4|nr:hypothetical protein [Crocosphaera sp. UHCC 0190]MEA5509461.1 hypothetical protein [Crocosphaera sp. UHCC 0190]